MGVDAAVSELHEIVVEFTSPAAHRGRVLVDGRELKGICAVEIGARVGQIVTLKLEVLPAALRVKMAGCDATVNEALIADVTAMGEHVRRTAQLVRGAE